MGLAGCREEVCVEGAESVGQGWGKVWPEGCVWRVWAGVWPAAGEGMGGRPLIPLPPEP